MWNERANRHKPGISQLSDFARNSYLDRTSRPIYGLAYLLGFMIFYEAGTIFINPDILSESLARQPNMPISFIWIQSILVNYLGFTRRMTWIAVPLVVGIILLTLQVTSRKRWRVYMKDFIPMTIECILLALPLIILILTMNRTVPNQPPPDEKAAVYSSISQRYESRSVPLQANTYYQTYGTNASAASASTGRRLFVRIVTGIGAGIYEELVFRLILICLLMLFFQDFLHVSHLSSAILSVLISAILFSAHHHIQFVSGQFQIGEVFTMTRFMFRTFAGVYLAGIFAVRGFGITAGTHAFYNIIAALIDVF